MRVRRALLFAPFGIEQTACFCWVSQSSQTVTQFKTGRKNLGETTCALRQGLALQHVEEACGTCHVSELCQNSIPLWGSRLIAIVVLLLL